MPAYVHTTHPASFIQMSIHALQLLTPLPLQPATALASHSPPIPVHRLLLGCLTGPALTAPLGLGNVGPDASLSDFP